MNQRLQELFKEAYGYPPAPSGEHEAENFALLIVKKCIDTCEFHGFNDAVSYIRWMATNHLGISE